MLASACSNLNTSGSLTFTDVDRADTHAASFVAQCGGYLCTFALDSSSTATSTRCTYTTLFRSADGATDYLQAGQTLTQKYDVTVDDGHGGTALQTITVTITGTNNGRAHV